VSRKPHPQTKRNPNPGRSASTPQTHGQSAHGQSAGKGQGSASAKSPTFLDHPWVAPSLLVLFTLVLWARSLAVPIIGGDDYVYFFRDARLEHVTGAKIWSILTQPFFANFHPFTTLTFALDRAVWGSWVPGFHITHVLFYAGGVVGIYFLFARVLRSKAAALIAAGLYAAHTVHVESVAWLASRKDVVCLFFYAMTLLAYTRYVALTSTPPGRQSQEASGRGATAGRNGATAGRNSTTAWLFYALSVLLAGIAMLSKGYAVALPVIVLAYDLCFTQRLTTRQILDKAPFVGLALMTIALTVHAQDRDSALVQVAMNTEQRLALLAKVFALYVSHSLVPIHLSAFYTVGGKPVEGPIVFLGALLALVLIVAFFALRRSQPAIAFGIALFLGPLPTVMNFHYTLRIWMTDRYLFFPTIGSCLAIVASVMAFAKSRARSAKRAPALRPAAYIGAAAIVLYAGLTFARIGIWTSAITLWSDTLRRELHLPGSGPVTAQDFEGRTDVGSSAGGPLMSLVESYRTAGMKAAADSLAEVHNRIAGGGGEYTVLADARKDLDAGNYDSVITRLKPLAENEGSWIAPDALLLVGVAQSHLGQAQASEQSIQRAFALSKEKGRPATDGYLTLGSMEFRAKNYPKAIEWYRAAYRESNQDAKAAFHLGRALEESGQFDEAMGLYQRIAKGELPILPEAQFTMYDVLLQMAVAAQRMGKPQDAIADFQKAIQLQPNDARRPAIEAQINALKTSPNFAIGNTEYEAGDYGKAIPWYRAACKEAPQDAKPAFYLGRALEESGQIASAMEIYQKIASGALTIGPSAGFTKETIILQMGVASQRLGKKSEAVGYYEQYLKMVPQDPKAPQIQAQIASLRSGGAAP
jgi:tetratricopeptide (TPR) repeat protein